MGMKGMFFGWRRCLVALGAALVLLGLGGCGQQSTPPPSPEPEEYNWGAADVSYYSDEEAQIIWRDYTYFDRPEYYLVERINLATGEIVSSFPISMEQNSMSYVRFQGGYILQRDVSQKEFSVYSWDGELLRQWTVEGDSSTFPGVSGDLSKFLDVVEKKHRLLVFSGEGSSVLWDSDRFDWFGDFAFFQSGFLGDNHIVFYGSTSDHRFYFGTVDLRNPEELPTMMEMRGDSHICPIQNGYMLSRGQFHGSQTAPFVHNTDVLILQKGEDGEPLQEFLPVPEAYKASSYVFGSHGSPHRVYCADDENYDQNLFVVGAQGELLWQTHLKRDDVEVAMYGDARISPGGETILLASYPNAWAITEKKTWKLPFPDDR